MIAIKLFYCLFTVYQSDPTQKVRCNKLEAFVLRRVCGFAHKCIDWYQCGFLFPSSISIAISLFYGYQLTHSLYINNVWTFIAQLVILSRISSSRYCGISYIVSFCKYEDKFVPLFSGFSVVRMQYLFATTSPGWFRDT